MSRGFDPDRKARLKSAGLWDRFVDSRAKLRDRQGGSLGSHAETVWTMLEDELTDWEKANIPDTDQADGPSGQQESRSPKPTTQSGDRADGGRPGGPKAKKPKSPPAEAIKGLPPGDVVEGIGWVASHLYDDADAIDWAACPGRLAANLWRWVVEGEGNRDEFMKNIFSKLIPSRAQLEKAKQNEGDDDDDSARLDEMHTLYDRALADESDDLDTADLWERLKRPAPGVSAEDIAAVPVLPPGSEGSGGESALAENDALLRDLISRSESENPGDV